MLTFHIVTIFPEILENYFNVGMMKKAQEENLADFLVYNLRDCSQDKHRKVDDTPYGGGPGMVMRVDVINNCVEDIKSKIKEERGEEALVKTKTILFSAKGKSFDQKRAIRWCGEISDFILICGRYEGVDERVVKKIADEEISVGKYILTGGELPAMIVADAVTRLIPGVLGNKESLSWESFSAKEEEDRLDYPVYTRPESYKGWKVPQVLLSGHHHEIEKWRKKNSKL
ncbi:MAG: tRNA (guanosine(37)-N1)-methyltransferase TrmD [Candidatus Moranbacteria bacterium]|nr:tRNA (guanosine(37)-N1)-methyltransferase TrmD [Candidatus Moranbacteria bacterium]